MTSQPEIPTFLTCEGAPIEVWIEVAGKMVPHYSIEYNAEKKEVSCWIASESDKPFAIMYKPTTDQYAMGLKIILDGVTSGGYIVLPEACNLRHTITGVQISDTEQRLFQFGCLQLTDDDAYLNKLAQNPHFGEIRLIVDKKTSFAASLGKVAHYDIPEVDKIHEKSKKGLTHHVKFGEKSVVATRSSYSSVSCGVIATFIVKYRPLEWLMATDIVARDQRASASPTPEPGPSNKRKEPEVKDEEDEEDEGENSVDEEERVLLAQLDKVRQKKLEREAEGGARKKIKLEPKKHFLPNEVIDLTDENSPAKSRQRTVVPKTPAPVIDLT
ncbi:hypothetical protein JR316_0005788 [Psilocybe cubensis]|uniref:Uncharacterized protein n=2 Tax=Psilocybe cubensis TaxID=181762 RepID=A0ACB8H071_PSICU|nr:hypothetical protein JR316_0005788 [Psilocybe cubensis]KAH9481266.1 hypothetical protein JR316_0005788 [Psilocybe cubensis]